MTQKEALDILKTGRNVFVTGPAGSGKTHLINCYIDFLRSQNVDVGITASTGIAATHMGGVTIHSWAGIGINADLSDDDLEAMVEKSYLYNRFKKVKVLIIDEVSMLHHFRFDLVNKVLKSMKGCNDPFGGIQVVLCGDFFQLPPVSRFGEPASEFIYKSDAWGEADFTICYLSEQFRHKDNIVTSILNEIRSGEVSKQSRIHLQSRMNIKTIRDIEPTKLFTHNTDVDTLNFAELEKLRSDEVADHTMETKGRDTLAESLKKSCLAPQSLRLKVGARVMCVKNNFEEGYVNGTLGVVISCRPGANPKIRTASGKEIIIEKASWKIEEDGKTKAEILQYPLRLAWAITVHKSQGMSLDAVEVDLSKSFETGMGYVALSRVRTLDGLTILGLNEKALQVNDEVLEFDKELQEASLEAQEDFNKMGKAKIEELQTEFLDYVRPKKGEGKAEKLTTYEETALLLSKRMELREIATVRGMTVETIVAHIEKLLEDEPSLDIAYLKKGISPTHFKKVEAAIKRLLKEYEESESDEDFVVRLNPIKSIVGPNVSYVHVQLARAILGYAPKAKKTVSQIF